MTLDGFFGSFLNLPTMANRHLSRSLAMQALFEWDFNRLSAAKLPVLVKRLLAEFAPGLDANDFVTNLVDGVVSHQNTLDNIIEKAAPDWPLEQIAIVDRNILRLGLFEMLFGNHQDVPARVAINEAIELAKTFGGENSGRFVNGVLGTIYKEMGEPGKDEVPAKKKKIKDIPYEQMPVERLVGAVVYERQTKVWRLALVHDVFGYWTLSKGHLEADEDLATAVKREIAEELGLTIEVQQELGTNEYVAADPDLGKVRRQVVYFLAEASEPDKLRLEAKGGLTAAEWFELSDILDLKIYDDIIPIITKAIKCLKERK